jgi:hypothetical protein
MSMTTNNKPDTLLAKRREQVRREWSRTERNVRRLAATLAQQQLFLLINCGPRSAAS